MATKKRRKKAKRKNPGHAAKKTTHRRKKRRNPSRAKKRTTHRRRRNPGHAAHKTHRRRRRHKKNPGLLGVILAPFAGVATEGVIKGVNAFAITNPWIGRGLSAVAGIGGAALSVNHPRLGAAIATGGLAASTVDPLLMLAVKKMTPKASAGAHGLGAIEASSGWPGRARGELSPGSVPMMNAVDVDISALDFDVEGIGAIVVR